MAAITRVSLQNNLGTASPILEQVGPGADRMSHRVILVLFYHFTRHRHDIRHGQEVEEIVIRGLEPELDGVLVENLDAFYGRVVIELAGFLGAFSQFIKADELAFSLYEFD